MRLGSRRAAQLGDDLGSPDPLRVLITNLTLAGRSGSEILTRTIALGLQRAGHRPMVYAPAHGPIVNEIRAAGVPVADDIGQIAIEPDVIHAHHSPTAATAATCFAGRPVVFLCQDFRQWHDLPPRLPNVLRHLVVSETLVDRLAGECGVPPGSISLTLNPIDVRRCRPGPPLPVRPRRAALFAKGRDYVAAVEEACRRAGLTLDMFGSSVGRLLDAPEAAMGGYDLIFASGLTAMEAMACGRACIVLDARGMAGMCLSERFDQFRLRNFGLGLLNAVLTPEAILAEVALYDAQDAARVAERVRSECDVAPYVDALATIYREVIAQGAPAPPPEPWRDALSRHLQLWGPRAQAGWPWAQERDALLARIGELETGLAPLEVGRKVEFAGADRRWRRLLGGFGRVEPVGVWTIAEEATLAVRVVADAGPSLTLHFSLRVFLHADRPRQHVEAIVNGRPKAIWRFEGQALRTTHAEIQLSPADIGPDGLVWLLLRIDDPVSPKALGLNSDERRLGVMLLTLELRASSAAR